MKSKELKSGRMMLGVIFPVCLFLLGSCQTPSQKEDRPATDNTWAVAAYVWPSCHDEPRSRETFWGEGIGEWEIIKKGDARFEGHQQPRIPLWGYVMDDDPVAWEKKISAATDHGVNTFIFDWYWYEGRPFLEEALDSGFLRARNRDNARFYLMWANHDVPGNMWNHSRYKTDSLIWNGLVNRDQYTALVKRVIRQYFKQPNYYTIDGQPVFSIFGFSNLVRSFHGLEGTKQALDYLREEAKKSGFPGVHIQVIGWGSNGSPYLLGSNLSQGKDVNTIISMLGINSVTTYNWTGAGINQDYIMWGEAAMALQHKWDSLLEVPYIPTVSVGWDNTPRYPEKGKESVVHFHRSPESFGAFLQQGRDYLHTHPGQPKLIIINAWNEWVEGSYLEPDMRWGYGYLETVKQIMSGKYDRYQTGN